MFHTILKYLRSDTISVTWLKVLPTMVFWSPLLFGKEVIIFQR